MTDTFISSQPCPLFHIALHEPEIPSNTGNIGRSCAATGSVLHLIDPLGFRLNDKTLARAGMDYWKDLDVRRYLDYEDFMQQNPGLPVYYATTKAGCWYTQVSYRPGCCIMFGKESGGIPEDILHRHPDRCGRIPMLPDTRSLNLANSVSIILYEALRQAGFPGFV